MSKCNLSDTQLEQIHQKLVNNTANMQPKERVAYQLNVLAGFEKSVPGITEQYKEYLNKKTESLLPTDAELKELDGLLDKITKGDKPGLGNLNSTEKARVFVLAEKAGRVTGIDPTIISRVKSIFDMASKEKPELTVDAIELLEKQKAIAQRNGDMETANKIDKLIQSLERSHTSAQNLKIDWDALEKARDKRDSLLAESAFLSALQQIGDSSIIGNVRKNEKERTGLLKKLNEKADEKRQVRESDDSEEDKEQMINDINAEIAQIREKIQKLDEKIFKNLTKESRNRRNKLDTKIAQVNLKLKEADMENSALGYVETLVNTALVDKSWYISSARDLFQKKKQVQDNIAFVKATIDNAPSEKQYSRGEVERLFGKGIATLPMVRSKFFEVTEDPATKKEVSKEKEFISKNEIMDIFENWAKIEEESVYDPKLDIEEAQIAADLVKSKNKDIITEVDPNSPQPVVRTRVEALKTNVGFDYKGGTVQDRVRLITDLQRVLGRLNTLSKLPEFGGLIPEWALVAALGTDAQSLFSLFDNALENPQGIFYDEDQKPMLFEDDHQRRTFLQHTLGGLGISQNDFALLPENKEDFVTDFRKVIGISFARNADGKIISVSQTIRVQELGTPAHFETRPLITSSAGAGQPLTAEDALGVLSLIEEQMNSGFKVVGHDILQPDGAMEALVLQSQNAKQGLRVALRLYDVGLLAFKGSLDNQITRFNTPTLADLTVGFANITIPGTGTVSQEQELEINSRAVIDVMFGMEARKHQDISVNVNGKANTITMPGVTPLWYDGTGNSNQTDHNSNYGGLNHLFDIQVFNNLKNFRGHAIGRPSVYNLTKVQSIATNLMIVAIEETNPDELNNILSGLIATPSQIDKHYNLVIKLSRQNHEAYLPILQEQREQNDNQFILSESMATDGAVVPLLTRSAENYATHAIKEVFETLRAYKRDAASTIAEFAKVIGFREQEKDEKTDVYLAKLFIYLNKQANENEYSLVDYGNGKFDYISAKQLGRGFAQVMLGHVREGNTLTQNIDVPLGSAAITKEAMQSDGTPLQVTDIEGNIEERQYLPLTRTNVSYFAPLSMYEQERVYSDFAMRRRYVHILNRDITPEDRVAFEKFIKENRIVEFKNAIQKKKAEIKDAQEAKNPTETLEKELADLKKAYNSYMEELDDRRLERGRVQQFELLNPVNNRDLYTRIPTIQESIEMSLEVALELPQLVATYVHDSRNFVAGSEMNLKQDTFFKSPGMSAGGPGAKATWAGIHPTMGFLIMYPDQYKPSQEELDEMIISAEAEGETDTVKELRAIRNGSSKNKIVNITPKILRSALTEGYKARTEGKGYSKSTYFDDKFSGIHHIVAAQEAYKPSYRKNGSLLNALLNIKNNGLFVTEDQIDDYYEKTYKTCVEHTEKLRDRINKNNKLTDSEKKAKLAQLDKVISILVSNQLKDGSGKPTSTARSFFKGVVIPIIYSGGYDAVLKNLKDKRNDVPKSQTGEAPSIGDLTDSDLALLTHTLTHSAGMVYGRLIDEIMDLELRPNKNSIANTKDQRADLLIAALTGDTERLKKNYALNISQLAERFPEVKNEYVSLAVLRGVIRDRVRYVAELSVKPSDVMLQVESSLGKTADTVRNELVEAKTEQLLKKWEDRLTKAEERIKEYHESKGDKRLDPGFEIGSELEREVSVILAGGMGQFKAQASLLFLNSVQNAGYKLNTTDQALLEHQVKTGRYIARDDLMFQNHVVFMTAGYGTATGRMEYPGNYLSNLQGSSLSKGLRLVYDKDDNLDVKESVLNSMWTLTNNPLEKLSKDEARNKAYDLAIKNYSLHLATDYDPDFLGYSREDESRENFFRAWKDRTEQEQGFTNRVRRGGDLRAKYRQLFREQQISYGIDPKKVADISDDEIDNIISSNSVDLDKRETVRILAPDALTTESGTLITAKDAKGLGAFIPRLADHNFNDKIVHGLFTMHHHTKRLREKGGRALLQIRTAKRKEAKLQDILDSRSSGSSVYDPESLPFVPVSGDSLPEFLLDHEASIMQKTAALQNTLDGFAYEYGYDDLVKTKDYARLYQIYQITLQLRKLSRKLHRMNPEAVTARELQMEHRNLVLNLFKLTKFQRDASGSERNILDFRRAVGIDPTKFKYADGTNMSYMDSLKVLAKLGIDELYTLNFGIYPTELAVLGDEQVDVLKDVSTIIRPFYVQGSDVAVLIMGFLSDATIKRRATEIVERKVKNGTLAKIATDKQGFVLLNELPETLIDEILEEVLQDDALVESAANNLNLYVTLEWGMNANETNRDGKPRGKIGVTEHAARPTAFIIPRPGIGDPVVNRTRVGFQRANFMLTAEAVKRILTGARNSSLLKRMEVAVQTNKYLGTRTNVDALRSANFKQIGEDRVQQVAEEVEMLTRLMGQDNPLRMLLTRGQSELKDEHGLTLNPYDAESYFYDSGEPTSANPDGVQAYASMNPFKAAISSHIKQAIKKGSAYVTLESEVKELKDFYNGNTENFTPIAYLIYLKYSVKDLTDANYKILVQETLGIDSLSDQDYLKIRDEADRLVAIMDKINFSPTKGRNPYLSLALKVIEDNLAVDTMSSMDNMLDGRTTGATVQDIPDIVNPGYKVREGHSFRLVRDPGATSRYTNKDLELKAQALNEAIAISNHQSILDVPAYPSIAGIELVQACYDPDTFNVVLPGPEGERIQNELANLVSNGTISESTAVFYRYLIATVFKNNPNLAPLLSITATDTTSNIAGAAIKQGDKFTIQLNTNILKNMGTVEQIRVFAHEMAHIARMAFIKDKSPEYNKILSIFRSKRGRDTISTMLLAMNGGKKYMGFDDDVEHYLNDPEEFIAQWGAWVLFQKTFNNLDLMKFLEKRNRGALATQEMWRRAVYAVSSEITGIASGLNQLDDQLRNDIFAVVDNMYGFTAHEARQVYVDNADQQLFMIANIHEPLLATEEAEYDRLRAMGVRSAAEQQRFDALDAKYRQYSPVNLSRERLLEARDARRRNSGAFSAPQLPTGRIIDNANELEVIDAFIQATMTRASTQSRASHTFGGLSRNMAERMFGVATTNKILNARSLLLMGVSSKYTYDCSDPIIAGLMNILSDTLSMHAYQFQRLGGSDSIRENRFFTKTMVERVVFERNELRYISKSTAEYRDAAQWAMKAAMGIVAPPPARPEMAAQARVLAQAMRVNSNRFRGFVYDNFASFQETLPIQLRLDFLGLGDPNKVFTGVSSSTAKAKQSERREEFRRELREMVRKKILSGHVDSNVIYVMHLLPREITTESLQEFRARQPGIDQSLRDELVEQFESLMSISNAAAQNLVDRIRNNNYDVTGILADPAILFTAFNNVVNTIYGRATVNTVNRLAGGVIARELQAAAIAALDVPVDNLQSLVSERNNVQLPHGVMRIDSFSEFSEVELTGDPSRVIANLFLGHVGNNAHYMTQENIITLRDILENPNTAEYADFRVDKALYQLERTQGYNAASERAIANITGITGLNIGQLIEMIKRNTNNFKVANKQELDKALIVLQEKIKIDQGLGIRDISEKHDFFEFMARWGPDIVRLTHGSNLNTASLLVEGGMGAIVSTMYGGNGARFLSTMFGSMLGTYWGRHFTQMEQRGAAVNLLMGVERMVQDAREVVHVADTNFDRNAGRFQKMRDWLRQSNNRGFMAVQAAMAEQAQQILLRNINNQNIDKLIKLIETANSSGKPITNMTELKEAMSKAGISRWKLNAHMAWILIQSGLLQKDVLLSYRYMYTIVNRQNTKGRGLDLQFAARWIERTRWDANGAITVQFGGRPTILHEYHARRAIQAIYFINKEFTNIVTVDNNAFDSATTNSVLQSLFFFYRQYPNLFLAQKVFRLGGRMDKTTFAALLISSTVFDLLYNGLLMVAAGAIPLTALMPWTEEALWKKDPMAIAKTFLTRNPIFSPIGNLVMESAIRGKAAYDKTKVNKYQNRYTKTKQGVNTALEELMPDFVGLTSAKLLLNNTLPTAIFGASSTADALIYGEFGGQLNDQEHWDRTNDLLRLSARVAGMDLILRAQFPEMIRSVFGERPVRLPMRPITSSPFVAPGQSTTGFKQPKITENIKPPTVKTETLRQQANTPLKAPKGL